MLAQPLLPPGMQGQQAPAYGQAAHHVYAAVRAFGGREHEQRPLRVAADHAPRLQRRPLALPLVGCQRLRAPRPHL